jgi:hypothetical protein
MLMALKYMMFRITILLQMEDFFSQIRRIATYHYIKKKKGLEPKTAYKHTHSLTPQSPLKLHQHPFEVSDCDLSKHLGVVPSSR